MKKKGSILIECLLGMLILTMAISIVLATANLQKHASKVSSAKPMVKYWKNLTHLIVYLPKLEPLVDISY